MYKVDVKQQNFQDALSTETTKTGFSKSLQEQMTYHNEDDAKKLAVKQGILIIRGGLRPVPSNGAGSQSQANQQTGKSRPDCR